jgi:hypothetical protein
MERGMRNFNQFCLHKRIMLAVKRVEVVSRKMYIILRGCWRDVIVLNVHALTENKIDDVNVRNLTEFVRF